MTGPGSPTLAREYVAHAPCRRRCTLSPDAVRSTTPSVGKEHGAQKNVHPHARGRRPGHGARRRGRLQPTTADGSRYGGAQALEKVTYLTSFGTFGRDAYAYVAKEKGYFADAGFDVDIKPGAGTGDNIKQIVAARRSSRPIDLTGGLLAAGGKGKVTGLHRGRRDPAAHDGRDHHARGQRHHHARRTSRARRSPTRPAPSCATCSRRTRSWPNVDATKVTWVNGTPQTLIGTLASGKVDGIGQFVVGKPTIETVAKGKKAVVLPYSDYLQRPVRQRADHLQPSYAKENPEKVKKFTAALLKGLQYSIDNPSEAGDDPEEERADAEPGRRRPPSWS